MTDRMTEFGVGPRFTVYSVIYCLIMYGLTVFFSPFSRITRVAGAAYQALAAVGAVIVVLGIPFYLCAIIPVMRAFKEGRLVTTGVYGMCRHPVYAAWLVFFVPAIALFVDSWLFLTAPAAMRLMAGSLVKKEDDWLERTFGKEYLEYKERVPAFMPYGWVKRGS